MSKSRLRLQLFSERLESRVLLSTTAAIRGTVFNDFSGDGIRQTDKPVIAGAVLYLDLNHNGKRDANEPAAVSTSTGAFSFSNLQPGVYQLREKLPANWEATSFAPASRRA